MLGVGWPIDTHANEPLDLPTYFQRAQEKYGRPRGLVVSANAFGLKPGDAMQEGDLVWTRTLNGTYYLGRVTGPWRYDHREEARDADIVSVLPCEWVAVSHLSDVPGKVLASFRARISVQRIHSEAATQASMRLYNRLVPDLNPLYPAVPPSRDQLFELVDDQVLETLVGHYLQSQGWWLLAGTKQHDTVRYEFELVHPSNGTRAAAQVKSGQTALMPGAFAEHGYDHVFLFSATASYGSDPRPNGVTCISPVELLEFVERHASVLPPAVQSWLA